MTVDPKEYENVKFLPKSYPEIPHDRELELFPDFSIPEVGEMPERADRRWLPKGEVLPPLGPEEGFAEVEFAWADREGSTAFLRSFIKQKKKTEMMRGFSASKAFRERITAWNKAQAEWRAAVRKDLAEAAKKRPRRR